MDFLLLVLEHVEYRWWKLHPGVAFVPHAKLSVRVIRRGAEQCQFSKSASWLSSNDAFTGLRPPRVPRQELFLVERGQIAHEATRDEPKSTHVCEFNAELVGIEIAFPARDPNIGGGQELVARHIEHVVLDLKISPPDAIELRIQ